MGQAISLRSVSCSLAPRRQQVPRQPSPANPHVAPRIPDGERDFEAQFASLTSILDQLSRHEVRWDRVKFRDQAPVGSGGYGEVRQATLDKRRSSNIIAVKILRSHGSKTQRARVAVELAREIHIMAKLSHPNIIPFVGFYVDRAELRTACILVPFMANGNVGEYLDSEDHEVGIQKRLEMALETGQGLLYLHSLSRPVCHADIKPENILVTNDLHVVICDFGISRVMSETNRFTTTSSPKGSTAYMSPELFTADSRSTLKSDVWAWGCLILKITSGTGPYTELSSQHAIVGHISLGIKPARANLIMTKIPYLQHLLDACWQFEPSQRLDMDECVSILSNIVALGSQRDENPALAVLHGLSRYRIGLDQITESGRTGWGGFSEAIAGRLILPTQGANFTETDVVIKKFTFDDTEASKRIPMIFAGEVGLLSQLSHANIITFIGFVEDLHSGVAWIVTRRAENGNVREFLSSGTWNLSHRISLLWDVATGVEYLHTYRPPIIHGDLKSLNVVVNEEGYAQIIDFGLSRMIESPDLEDGFTGSTRWASPEVLYGNNKSLESDIWSLGWTFWEILTGRIPFEESKNDGTVVMRIIEGNLPSIGGDLVQAQTLGGLIIACLRQDPKTRPKADACRGTLEFMPRTPPVKRDEGQEVTGSPASLTSSLDDSVL